MEIEALGPLLGWARDMASKKALLREYGLPVPKGEAVSDREGVRTTLLRFGGRGLLKAPGRVLACSTPEEGVALAEGLFEEVGEVLVEEEVELERTFSLSLLLMPVEVEIVLSARDLGSGARSEIRIDPLLGYSPYQGRKVALELGLSSDLLGQFAEILGKVLSLFTDMGLNLLELGLGLTKRWTFAVVDVGALSPWPRVLRVSLEGVGVITPSETRAMGLVDLLEGEGIKVAKVLILPRAVGPLGEAFLQRALEQGFQILDWGLHGWKGASKGPSGLYVLTPEGDLGKIAKALRSDGL